ncbi:MAG: hypothetical protein K6G55_05600 [Selenomonadaceae bacterium]|nr:hypothetical protein [Selenomonadaceae bacterium]
MARRNVFEMLGLEFDPPDNLKKIRAAYTSWKKRLTTEQNTTVDPQRQSAIASELSMDNYITVTINDARLRQNEAENLKQQRIEELRLYIDLQRGDETDGTLQVNQSQIKLIREKLRLSQNTIEATYREQGYEIKTERTAQKITATLNNFFLSDSLLDELSRNIEELHKVPDAKNFPWSAKINDLYDLAYYLEGEIEPSSDFYRSRRSAQELHDLFRDSAKKYSAPIPQWQAIKSLLNLAQSQVFSNDESRFKYEHSLKIEKLSDFFSRLKNAPEIFKRDKHFADNCIARIRRTFPNFLTYEMSVALYNKNAGLLKNPYEATNEDEENYYWLTCGNCGGFEKFRTREEAQHAKCKICGESYYVSCPKCGKYTPSTADHCTNCDFSFGELKKFSMYISEANSLLSTIEKTRMPFETAKQIMEEVAETISRARMLKPESNELRKTEWRAGEITKAIERHELQMWAEKTLPALTISSGKAVSECMKILNKLKDYKPALDRLKLIEPKAPLNVTASMRENYTAPSPISSLTIKANATGITNGVTANLVCNISWKVPNDLGIAYTLMKKEGGVPKDYCDGEILIENSDRTEYADINVKPGVVYGYAVYSTRLGNFSSFVTASAVHYSDLDENKMIAKTENGVCKFSWQLPAENCLGVRILRSDGMGRSVVVADCVQANTFTDTVVKNREQYSYRLQCVYAAPEDETNNSRKYYSRQSNDPNLQKVWKIERTYKYSDGLTRTLIPEKPPKMLENLKCTVRDKRAYFRWQQTGEFDIWFKKVSGDSVNKIAVNKIFNLNKADELFGSDVVLKKAISTDEKCDFELDGENVRIAVISATREIGLLNEVFNCADVEPCEIDTVKTKIDGGGLKLVLKSVPENLYMIHYKVNTEDADELYATIETAKARQMNRIYATKYAQDTFITQTHLPQKEIFITVIGEYKFSDGSAAYSQPSTMILNNRPKEIITYYLEWGTTGFLNKTTHAKNCRLVIESLTRPTPEMYLACRRDGHMNIEQDDSSTQILWKVRTYNDGYYNGRLETNLPNSIWKNIAQGTAIKLLTGKSDEKYFDLQATRPDSLIVPKK